MKIDIIIAAKLPIPRSWSNLLKVAARVTWAHLPDPLRFPATATLLLTDDATVRQLNRDFRGIDRPTNVLSFPQFTPRHLAKKGTAKKPVELGDIAIAYQYVVAEARENHKILIDHVTHLMIHGLLHLFGYDHLSDQDALRMEGLEMEIMAALGLPDPYHAVHTREMKKAKPAARKRRTAVKPKK